jgi:hypothetical protein
MSSTVPSGQIPPSWGEDDLHLHEQARRRLEARRGLRAHLLAYTMVNALLVAVWALSGAGFFWPVFPLLGWGIGVAFHVLGVLSPEPTEPRIRAEMERLRQRSDKGIRAD